ncbi:RagB/SusD family nutrient uptake outer membrane protein [Niabella sp. 22666]|uniref:RagB/SusD family nutrient uptake outer membrane protein n=1 Tax=Niabella sp. 22666 TaxID=3453954 RepID=UPI003F863321
MIPLLFCMGVISSCKKFLDIVPDNIATIESAFKLRKEAERYLFACYSYLPKYGDGWYNPSLTAADEIWYPQNDQSTWQAAFRIAQGQQNKSTPYFDEWSGRNRGQGAETGLKIWRGINQCNIFLENMKDLTKVRDITQFEREKWIAEAEFLKAYYHYYMLRMYGPIPLMEKSINIDASDIFVRRQPVDSCVNWIAGLLDEAASKLPLKVADENTELGRITQPIALAVKAKLLMMAASPLFNGNPDFSSFTDKEGVQLFSTIYDPLKWEKARDACGEAIRVAEENGAVLYTYKNDIYRLSDTIKTQLNIRNALTTWWNPEIIWSHSNSYFNNESLCMPPVERGTNFDRGGGLRGLWAPPLKIVKLYYSANGVPIDEDKMLNFSNFEELRTAKAADKYYIEPNFLTARLHFDREPRFYAAIGFDGSIFYMKDSPSGSDEDTYYIKAKNAENAGYGHFQNYSETGYFVKKLVNWESSTRGVTNPTWKGYPWPMIRLADLYLLYAEAINEVEGGSSNAISYVDKVRARAGLKGVVESWSNYSNNPTKFSTKDGLRQIIQRERSIEMMFEGERLWDLKRWKLAAEELNKDITGWNIFGKAASSFYQQRFVFKQSFITPRDYFWPVGDYDTRRNPYLVENPGW